MKKIAIVNNKGGCGKTTTVFNLAHYFAKQGLKTLTVDTDPQLNLSTNFGINVNELNFSLGDYLLERSNGFEPEMLNENLHLISAGPEAEKDMEELKNQGPYYYQLLNNFLENLSEKFDITVTLGNITKIVEDSIASSDFSTILKICNLKNEIIASKEIKEIASNFKEKALSSIAMNNDLQITLRHKYFEELEMKLLDR